MRFSKFFLLLLLTFNLSAQESTVGIFSKNVDIGNPKLKGGIEYYANDQSYRLQGAGYNIWFGRDEFQFAYNQLKGDFILTANFQLLGTGTDLHRKIGWMIRETLDDNSAHISATVHGDGSTMLQWRPLRGAFMRDPEDQVVAPKKIIRFYNLNAPGRISLCVQPIPESHCR